MSTGHFRFYEELNEYLPVEKRKKRFAHSFNDLSTVGSVLESLGIPLQEIDLLLVNEKSADFSRTINDGDFVSVYPVFESMDISSLASLPSRPLRKTRFFLDVHLGKLARKLRLLGFDSQFENNTTSDQLICIMEKGERIVLTQNRRLLQGSGTSHGYWVREETTDSQTVEILHRFDLLNAIRPFTLCLGCNLPLTPIEKSIIRDDLPPRIRRDFELFHHCPGCGRNYWHGSHFEKMKRFINQVKQKAEEARRACEDSGGCLK